jgi:hypothetical protein
VLGATAEGVLDELSMATLEEYALEESEEWSADRRSPEE